MLARFGGLAEVAQILVVPNDPNFEFPQLLRVNLAYDRELPWWGLIASAEVIFSDSIKEVDFADINLDELCTMLWDMVRYQNYDVESPYNREAALWAKTQRTLRLPVDPRPIRDQLSGEAPARNREKKPPITASRPVGTPEVVFIDDRDDIVEAEVVEPEDPDILFIE